MNGQRVGCGPVVAEVVVSIAIRDQLVGHRETGLVVYAGEVLLSAEIGQHFPSTAGPGKDLRLIIHDFHHLSTIRLLVLVDTLLWTCRK